MSADGCSHLDLRLTSVTDATGRQTIFSYGLAARPLLVTQISDPLAGVNTVLLIGASAVVARLRLFFTVSGSGGVERQGTRCSLAMLGARLEYAASHICPAAYEMISAQRVPIFRPKPAIDCD